MFRLRFVPDNTRIKFMRGRIIGLVTSAVLSIGSVILYFYPGLNYGIDFRGGIVIEARTSGPADFAALRSTLNGLGLGEAALQQFGGPNDVLVRLERQPGGDEAQQVAVEKVRAVLTQKFPGTELRRVEAVGATVSDTLFENGMIALGLRGVIVRDRGGPVTLGRRSRGAHEEGEREGDSGRCLHPFWHTQQWPGHGWASANGSIFPRLLEDSLPGWDRAA